MEVKLEIFSKDENLEFELDYVFFGNKNFLEENGLKSRDMEVEENKVKNFFEVNDFLI